MGNAIFPTLKGLTWDIVKTPMFSTQIIRSVGGNEIRASYYQTPLWSWKMSFEFLDNEMGSTKDLDALLKFYTDQEGAYTSFLFADPTQLVVDDVPAGTGDGHTQIFNVTAPYAPQQMFYPVNSYPYMAVDARVYISGTLIDPAHYALSAVNSTEITITFTDITPADHAPVKISNVLVWWRCRFADDSLEFNEFMYNLWDLKTLTIQSVRDAT